MASLPEIRQKFPQYDDMSDKDLADAIYGKFYADMPRDDFNAKIGFQPVSDAEDIARSAATGIGEGATGSVGLLGDVQSMADSFGTWVGDQFGLSRLPPEAEAGFKAARAPTTADIEKAIGFDEHKYEPQTVAGQFARTAGQFATPAVGAGIGKGVVRTGIKYGVIPGVVSESAGQLTEGTAAEPYARAAAALTAGGITAVLSRPTQASAVIKKAMPDGVTTNDIMKADSLMAEARSRGVQLTWPEALHQTTGGRVDITGLQRLVEQTKGGAPVMGPMMSDRPAQVTSAMGDAMEDLTAGARMTTPEMAGLSIQRTATERLNAIRQQINAATEPLYSASKSTRLDPAEFARLSADPLYQSALKAVRSDPVYSRQIGNLADDTVGVANEVKKYLDDMAGASGAAVKPQAAATYGGVRDQVKSAATAASSDYERALGLQSDMRRQILDPIEIGPLGKMSRTDDIAAQGKALLAGAPVEGSQQAVGQTVRLLSQRAPNEAYQLVRTHLRNRFDETAQSLISGGNQWGGAKFAAEIKGNGQQAKNLEAAVRALPDGDARWEGLQAFLDVMEATGRRQRPGSLTAFNAEALEDLKRGGLPTETARTVRSLGTRLFDFYDQWKLGKNTEALARMITDPNSGKMLSDLAKARTPAGRQTLAGYLVVYYAGEAPRTMQRQEQAIQPPPGLP